MAVFFVPFFRVRSHSTLILRESQYLFSHFEKFGKLHKIKVVALLDIAKLENIAKENGKSFSFLSEKVLGKYRTFLKDVKANRAKISDEQIAMLSNALNTTPEYLKGETDIKEKAAPVSGSDLSERDIQFLEIFRQLSVEEQDLFLKMFRAKQE